MLVHRVEYKLSFEIQVSSLIAECPDPPPISEKILGTQVREFKIR